jgi:hypothetical protein
MVALVPVHFHSLDTVFKDVRHGMDFKDTIIEDFKKLPRPQFRWSEVLTWTLLVMTIVVLLVLFL